jgi:thymidylate synthase
MNKLDKDYQDLLKDILDNGYEKKDRTGTGTISVFGRTIRHKMSDGFPLLTTKKMYMKGIVTELLWFLNGDTNIKYLIDNNCHIWNGDAFKNYISKTNEYKGNWPDTMEEFIETIKTDNVFAKKWGDLGKIYGFQWRNWGGKTDNEFGEKGIDQIADLINDLKTNPDSRRLLVSAWAVHDLPNMVLPPCHYGFQVYTRELSWDERHELAETKYQLDDTDEELDKHNIPTRAISLMWNQRSVDTFLGLPFNIASYGLLLEMLAKEVNMVPDELIGNLGDVHLYSNHVEGAKEQIGRELSIDERNELLNQKINRKHKREDCFSDDEFIRETIQDCEKFEIPTRTREPYPLPKLVISNGVKMIDGDCTYNINDFELLNYKSHNKIKADLSN